MSVYWLTVMLVAPHQVSVEDIRSAYQQAKLPEAAQLLDSYLARNPLPEQRREALLLAPSVYLSVDRSDDARAAVRELVTLDPTLQPPTGTSPRVRTLFDEERLSVRPPTKATAWYSRPWLWAGVGGVILAGVGTWLLLENRNEAPEGDLGPITF
ncbi:MAG: tetratricopeptide repeat protein [Myxococcota bacterium]